ncbi:MAG: nucleotidyltransferase domain-containing protein [bacterium]|nr:nucleotidyltransferase domain-containing protein [bacterium]
MTTFDIEYISLGSLTLYLKGLRIFKESSDIDLVVQPISKERYFYILAEIDRMSEFDVDIIDLEDCPEMLRNSILKNGILLYEE